MSLVRKNLHFIVNIQALPAKVVSHRQSRTAVAAAAATRRRHLRGSAAAGPEAALR